MSQASIWGKSIPGQGSSKNKGPGAGVSPVCLRGCKEQAVAGNEDREERGRVLSRLLEVL